jgi:hypothetical protein
MSCFKRFAVVVGAVAMMASSSFAAWDMFPVLDEAGKAQAKIEAYGGFGLKFRFSPMENLEIFGTNSIANLVGGASYGLGARYQIVPSMLSAFLDVGIPTGDYQDIGFVPGIQFSTNFGDKLSLGLLVGLGIDIDQPVSYNPSEDNGVIVNLGTSLELDYSFSDAFGGFVGVNFDYQRLNYEYADGTEPDVVKEGLSPYFGVFYTAGNMTVATAMGLRLNAINKDGEESVGLWGGVDVTFDF